MKWLLLSLLSLFFVIEREVKLNTDPTNEGSWRLTEWKTVMDDEGFYQGTSAWINPNNEIIVLDRGNKKVLIYNENGKLQSSFGKEGNGPGELFRPITVFTVDDHIVVRQDMKMNIFKMDGTHVKDVRLLDKGNVGTPQPFRDQIILMFEGPNIANQYIYLDKFGDTVKEVANPEYKFVKDQGDNVRVMIRLHAPKMFTEDGLYERIPGPYKFQKVGADGQPKVVYTKSFDRVKRDFSRYQINIDSDNMSKEELKRQRQAMYRMMMKRLGEYQDDVNGIIGTIDGHVFVRTASEGNGSLHMDVIHNDKLVDQIKLDLGETQELNEIRLIKDKLVLNIKNDDDGPFVKIYQLKNEVSFPR